MKRFYSQFRIMLMTFALGLASVFVFNGSLKYSDEVSVNLPNVQSEFPIFVFPIEGRFISLGAGGGASGGITCDEARKKAKNKKIKIPNCD